MTAPAFDERMEARIKAAYWLNRRRAGDMSANDERAFQVWLDLTPANRKAYQALERHWEFLGSVAQDPEIMASRERDARAFNRPSHLRRAGALAACLVLAVTAGWSVFSSGLLVELGVLQPPEGQTFRTSVGQRTTVTLPDGSVVTLDTDTVMRLRETRTRRLIDLDRGRAFFRVAKDPSRPFVVAVAGKTVQATGTAFDVRMAPDQVTVTLVEGKVIVEQPRTRERSEQQAAMVAGDQLLARDGYVWAMRAVDVKREMSWLDGRLTFFHDPLSQAVAEVNRYSEKKVVFRGGRIPDKRIVGVFRAGDVESFAKAVELNRLGRITSATEERIEIVAE